MLVALNVGQFITPRRRITPGQVSHWTYRRECASIGGGLEVGAELKIVAISKTPGQVWVQIQLPGSDPPATIKIAGQEYAHNFVPVDSASTLSSKGRA
jgi:hypothetical protein